MSNVNRRLENLERASKPLRGLAVVYTDDSDTGVFWDRPIYDSDRRRYTHDERVELEAGCDDLFIVKYVRDWRSVS